MSEQTPNKQYPRPHSPLATPEVVHQYRGFICVAQAIVAKDGGLAKCKERLQKFGRLNAICMAHLEGQNKRKMTHQDWDECWRMHEQEEARRGERGEDAEGTRLSRNSGTTGL